MEKPQCSLHEQLLQLLPVHRWSFFQMDISFLLPAHVRSHWNIQWKMFLPPDDKCGEKQHDCGNLHSSRKPAIQTLAPHDWNSASFHDITQNLPDTRSNNFCSFPIPPVFSILFNSICTEQLVLAHNFYLKLYALLLYKVKHSWRTKSTRSRYDLQKYFFRNLFQQKTARILLPAVLIHISNVFQAFQIFS